MNFSHSMHFLQAWRVMGEQGMLCRECLARPRDERCCRLRVGKAFEDLIDTTFIQGKKRGSAEVSRDTVERVNHIMRMRQ